MLKLAISQLNYTVGDFVGNTGQIIAAMARAAKAGADLIVFSELAICGYYPGDLLEDIAFLHKMEVALDKIKRASQHLPELVVVLGTVRKNKGPGKPLHNALLALQNGQVVAEYYKQLLPTYGIFDEYRHFEPGPEGACILSVKGHRVGFLICEDGWNQQGLDYKINPFNALRDQAPDLVVSINASPSNIGKRKQRHKMFAAAVKHTGLPLLYVNQVGGQDQLVFDGASFAISPRQGVVFEAAQFEIDFQLLGFAKGHFCAFDGSHLAKPVLDDWHPAEFTRRQIILGLQDYARRCNFKQVVVGCSGGIDSAVTLALAVQALGADNVIGITMPSRFSSSGSVTDSELLCQQLGIKLYHHPIRELVQQYGSDFAQSFNQPLGGLALENLQARVRGTILMEFSNAFGALLLTTGNKSEISVGYCTLYGDTNGGLGLIGDLYKTEVFELARHLNHQAGRELVPAAIIDKPPSAELAPDQKDTDSLPPYEVLDEILKWHVEGRRLSHEEWRASSHFVQELVRADEGKKTVARILKMVARNEYKRRQAPPIIRVRSRAFGSGRQMPIAAHYG